MGIDVSIIVVVGDNPVVIEIVVSIIVIFGDIIVVPFAGIEVSISVVFCNDIVVF